jgi:hypothetical protein
MTLQIEGWNKITRHGYQETLFHPAASAVASYPKLPKPSPILSRQIAKNILGRPLLGSPAAIH